jgi:hypothetical protein
MNALGRDAAEPAAAQRRPLDASIKIGFSRTSVTKRRLRDPSGERQRARSARACVRMAQLRRPRSEASAAVLALD